MKGWLMHDPWSCDDAAALSTMVTLDDIMTVMLIKNLNKQKEVWANYQSFKDFFTALKEDPKEWATKQVRDIINDLSIVPDIDHCMTRVSGLSGVFSYYAYVGSSYWRINASVKDSLRFYRRMRLQDRSSLDEISRRYGEHLRNLGR
jgi:hypothetical protein